MPVYFPVRRTFAPFTDSDSQDQDFEAWARFARVGRERPSWEVVESEDVAVVVGEPLSGKTEEFKERARGLRAGGKPAFFIPLDAMFLTSVDDALDVGKARLDEWLASTEEGYFYLDSVDEARIVNAGALRVAFHKLKARLGPAIARTHIVVSSRITDWCAPAVQEAVRDLQLSRFEAKAAAGEFKEVEGTVTVERRAEEPPKPVTAFQIEPLSREATIVIATGLGLQDPEKFWVEIETSSYEPFAARPGDLEWLVRRWKSHRNLGGLADLIESAIEQRLTEKNDGYVSAGVALAHEKIRPATRALAAASVFSGKPLFQVDGVEPGAELVIPAEVLPHLSPNEHRRVLGSAIFDAPSLGKARFHHRAVREYLAAEWVAREIAQGLPIDRALGHFVRKPFGAPVLLANRRGTLCWLAVLEPRVREYVVAQFPEMVMFEGDPTRWVKSQVIEAFQGYLELLHRGFWQDWWNDATEYARVSRALPPETLARGLAEYRDDPAVLVKVLNVVKYGRVAGAADVTFEVFKDPSTPVRARHPALWTLAEVARTEQRLQLKQILVDGGFNDNDFRAAGLAAVGIAALTEAEITAFLHSADPGANRTDSLSSAILHRLLPGLSYTETIKLLRATYAAIPTRSRKDSGQRFGDNRPRFAWLLEILPDIFKHAVETMPAAGSVSPSLIEAAVLLESLRSTQFANANEMRRLRNVVAKNPETRRAIALAIGLAAPNGQNFSHLTGFASLVCLEASDEGWVSTAAVDPARSREEQRVWFLAAMDLIPAAYQHGSKRRAAVQALLVGPDAEARRRHVADDEEKGRRHARILEQGAQQDVARERAEQQQRLALIRSLRTVLDEIRAGTHLGALSVLINVCRSSGDDLTNVDPTVVSRDLDPDIGRAFEEGLSRAYLTIDPPDPLAYFETNEVPWAGLIGLASANHVFRGGVASESASEADVVRAIRFCVWGIDSPEPWVEEAASLHGTAIEAALAEQFESELARNPSDHSSHTVSFILQSPHVLRERFIRRALALMSQDKILSAHYLRRFCQESAGVAGSVETVREVARRRLETAAGGQPPKLDAVWFGAWVSIDLPDAWAWVKGLVQRSPAHKKDLAGALAGALGEFTWTKSLQGTRDQVVTLEAIFKFVEESFPLTRAVHGIGDAASQALRNIPGVIASWKNASAYEALRRLADGHSGDTAAWLNGLASEVASAVAEASAQIEPSALLALHEPYTHDPENEHELFLQVIDRLNEVRQSVEKGPFSVRELFYPRIPESKLQKWLADKLNDTPRRRFTAKRDTVSREAEADLRNKPDLTVSAPQAGAVSIEVKPLATGRYSAVGLRDTLAEQIEPKYLERAGTRHAVLVVMNLEDKAWQIPGGRRDGSFADLITYLKAEAEGIRAESALIDALEIVEIDCTEPGRPTAKARSKSKARAPRAKRSRKSQSAATSRSHRHK